MSLLRMTLELLSTQTSECDLILCLRTLRVWIIKAQCAQSPFVLLVNHIFFVLSQAHAVVVTAAMFAPVPWLIIPPDSSCQPFTTEVLVTADWSGAIKLFVNG